MEQADWKSYHGYMVVRRKAGLLRSSRFDVWRAGHLVASFRDPIKAEIFIDSQLDR